jgi:hypothetical protein
MNLSEKVTSTVLRFRNASSCHAQTIMTIKSTTIPPEKGRFGYKVIALSNVHDL